MVAGEHVHDYSGTLACLYTGLRLWTGWIVDANEAAEGQIVFENVAVGSGLALGELGC